MFHKNVPIEDKYQAWKPVANRLSPIFILIFGLIIAGILSSGFVTDDPVKKILLRLREYHTQYPQEKVHLHLDKPYYAAGDSIWFKAYVVTAEDNKLSGMSNILYAELINDRDSVVQSLRLPLAAGLGSGNFSLADTLQEGKYRVRAYTQWMRNFGEDYFFDKAVPVGNVTPGNVSSDIQYVYKEDKNRQSVLVTIHYKDLKGNSLVNKEVTYTVQQDDLITHDTGTTDANGNLKITFTNKSPVKPAKISTVLHLSDEHTVSKSFPLKRASSDSDVQFFPEGGDMVSGIRSIVAFKATGSGGLATIVTGYVTDQDNNKIADIRSEHAGMGAFILYPQAEQTYAAHIRFGDGSEKTFTLPKVLPQGYGLSVENTGPDNLNVRISATPELVSRGEIILLAQSNGVVKYASKTIMDKSVIRASIPRKRLPTGIVQLTLFAPDQLPAAERLVFINHGDGLNLNINTSKSSYGKREKVKMTLDVKDVNGDPVTGSFSLAVTDESKVPYDENNETSINSNLLLTSDLKGYIEQPNYYFTDVDANKLRQLDLLMMTQGWRRFEWKKILANEFPALTFTAEKGIEVTGRVTSLFTGKPVTGGRVALLPLSDTDLSLLSETRTDAEGRFRFENLFFADSTKFSIQAKNVKDRKNTVITLDTLPTQPVTGGKNVMGAGTNINLSLVAYLKNATKQVEELRRHGLFGKSIKLAEVKIVDRRKEEISYNLDRYGRIRSPKVITSADIKNCMNLLICLPAKTLNLMVKKGILFSTSGTPVTVMLDGVPVKPEDVQLINAQDIDHVLAYNGRLIMTTKRGELTASTKYIPGITSYAPKGYYRERIFYSPRYDVSNITSKMPDLRTTIFWAPHVVTDSTGKAVVEFFNADGNGNYRVIAEGMSLDGTIGRKIYRYAVK